jgi:hypothetical protein
LLLDTLVSPSKLGESVDSDANLKDSGALSGEGLSVQSGGTDGSPSAAKIVNSLLDDLGLSSSKLDSSMNSRKTVGSSLDSSKMDQQFFVIQQNAKERNSKIEMPDGQSLVSDTRATIKELSRDFQDDGPDLEPSNPVHSDMENDYKPLGIADQLMTFESTSELPIEVKEAVNEAVEDMKHDLNLQIETLDNEAIIESVDPLKALLGLHMHSHRSSTEDHVSIEMRDSFAPVEAATGASTEMIAVEPTILLRDHTLASANLEESSDGQFDDFMARMTSSSSS